MTTNDKGIKKIGAVAVVLWLFMLAVVAWKWRVLPPEIPLLYSLPDGEAQLGARNDLAVLVGVTLVVTMINIWLAVIIARRDSLAGQFMVWAAVMVNFMIVVTIYRIVTLVAS